MPSSAVVLDTNVLVAAGFNPRSASCQDCGGCEAGGATDGLERGDPSGDRTHHAAIPPLRAHDMPELFRPEDRYTAPTHPQRFAHIPDPDDRKFAALAHATDAKLISNDDHLLRHRDRMDVTVLTPHEFWNRHQRSNHAKGGHDPAIWMHRGGACVTTPDSGRGTQRRATAPGACVLCMRSCVG